jgi:hypothetical protein
VARARISRLRHALIDPGQDCKCFDQRPAIYDEGWNFARGVDGQIARSPVLARHEGERMRYEAQLGLLEGNMRHQESRVGPFPGCNYLPKQAQTALKCVKSSSAWANFGACVVAKEGSGEAQRLAAGYTKRHGVPAAIDCSREPLMANHFSLGRGPIDAPGPRRTRGFTPPLS